MHDERIDSDACDRLDEGCEERIIVAIINADAALTVTGNGVASRKARTQSATNLG